MLPPYTRSSLRRFASLTSRSWPPSTSSDIGGMAKAAKFASGPESLLPR